MFCSQCGKQINEGSKFCAFCGAQVANIPQTSQSQPQAFNESAEEKVVWVFRVDHKLKLFKIVPCYIVFMEDKVVFAYLTPELQKSESAKASRQIKENKLGFFKGSAAMMKYWADYYKKYYTMSSNEILAEDPTNMMVLNHQISRVYFDCADMVIFDNEDVTSENKGKLYFDINGRDTLKFVHSQANDRSVKDTLTQLFGDRLKYSK